MENNFDPSISGDGHRIVFMSNRDLTPNNPGNADGDWEIFLWIEGRGIIQITDTVGGDQYDGFANGWPVINEDGTRIAFHSTRDLVGGRKSENLDIFLWTEGRGFTQITDTDDSGCPNSECPDDVYCGSSFAISLNASGSRLAFYSDRDVVGRNRDRNSEIFLWDERDGIRQITDTEGGCMEANRLPSISRIGQIIAFESTRDHTPGRPGNEDGNKEIFLWEEFGGFTQITDTIQGNSPTFKNNVNPSINADGSEIVFWSDRDLLSKKDGSRDGSYQLYHWISRGGFIQLTDSTGCNFPDAEPRFADRLPAISVDGSYTAFSSNCNLTEENPSLRNEIFRAKVR